MKNEEKIMLNGEEIQENELFNEGKKRKHVGKIAIGGTFMALACCASMVACQSCNAKPKEELPTNDIVSSTPVEIEISSETDSSSILDSIDENEITSEKVVTIAKEYKNYLDEQGVKMTEEMQKNGVEADMSNTITEQDLYSLVFTANIENIDSEERNKMIELGLISRDAETIKAQTDSTISYIMSNNIAYVSVSETLEKNVNTDLLISLEKLFTDVKDAENAKTLHQNYVNIIGKDKNTIVSSYMDTRDFINYSTRTSYPYSIHEDTVGARYLLRTVYGIENLTYSTNYLPKIERDEFQKSVLNVDEFIGYLYDLCGNNYSNENQKQLTK